jgi:hypothetical protein
MAITFDGPNKRIVLDGATTVGVRAIYSRWVDWFVASDNFKYLPAFTVIGDPPTVPTYATLVNGWRVRPAPGAYTLIIDDGFLSEAGGADPFAPVLSGIEPRIVYHDPVVAVGYSTASPSQADITAIKRNTDLIPVLL